MRPKETTPLLHDSDTIVNLPSADEQLILFCVFEGECAMSTFSVKASYADTVDDLKKLVKAAKTPNFDAMPADRFKLTAVSVPVEPATEAVAVKVQSLDYHRFLRPTELLCEVFEDTVPRNTIHIVVDMMPTVNYGSIPVSITAPEEDLFTIFVIKEGQSTSQAFSVRAHPANTVDDLRKAIWSANRLRVGYLFAQDVPLALVSIPDESHTMHENQWLYHTTFKRALRPTEFLADVFDNRPPAPGTIHIIIGDVRRVLSIQQSNLYTQHPEMNASIIRPGDYGSTGTTPTTKIQQYTIFIIHNGQSTSEAFSVKALSNETVDDVKKLIKIVRTPALDRIPADKLRLVRVDIPDDPATNYKHVSLTHSPLAVKRSLRSTELLRDVFLDPPEQGKIHMVIESGEPELPERKMTSNPIFTPHTAVNYGSTAQAQVQAQAYNFNIPVPYTIFVIHSGQSTSEAFSVKALSTDTVDDLKKLIKAAKAPLLDYHPADKLKLIGVSIPDDPAKEYEKICAKHTPNVRPLRATEVLEDLFMGRLPERGRIHVLIESVEPTLARTALAPLNQVNLILVMETHSCNKIEMDEQDSHQQQAQPQQPHTIIALDSISHASSPAQAALALPSCPDQPAETPDRPYPVLPTTTEPASSYPALPSAPFRSDTDDTLLPLEPLDTVEPLSNPVLLDTNPLTLFCLIDGQSTKQAWSIKALPADTVDDMKKAVKVAQAPSFDHVVSGELQLRKVYITDHPEKDTIPVYVKNMKCRELRATETVAEVYPRGTIHKAVQVMVMKPAPKPHGGRGGSGCGMCEALLVTISLIVSIIALISGNNT
ncbi:hypothetical protein BGZ59_004539 [Podila verticillata]|nr:hypothetical protein BGZ59_004539 [Podila verticillata]